MTEVALSTAVLLALVTAIGLPPALALRRAQDGWVAVTVEAAGLGLLIVPLGVTAWAWLGVAGISAVAALWSAGVVGAWHRGLPRRKRPDRVALVLGLGWVVVLGTAGLLRLREVRFLPWIGDMGAYVNWANELVRTGELTATWPPLFPAWLSLSTALFGPEHTTVGMATTGLVLLVLVARLVHLLGGGRAAALGAGAIVAGSVHPVWFASFPTSEGLDAPLFVLWAILVHRTMEANGARERATAGVAAGVTFGALGMLRGSGGLLLLPLALLVVAVISVRDYRPLARGTWSAAASALVASAVVYWYGITEINKYFVLTQLRSVLPRSAWRALDDLGLYEPTWRTALVVVLIAAATVALGGSLVRRSGRWQRGLRTARPALPVVAAALLTVVVWQAAVGGEVWAILQRMSLGLLALALVGATIAVAVRDAVARLVVLLLVTTSLLFVALHSVRLGEARVHSFFLYWDRYLVSEVLPINAVLAMLAAAWAVRWLIRTARVSGARALVTRTVALAAAVAVVTVPGLGSVRLATQDVYLRGAYELTVELRDLVAGRGGVFWGADGRGGVRDFTVFPNAWMAFAVPLERTFGVEVFNVNQGPANFQPDQVLRNEDLGFVAACSGYDSFTLLEVATVGGVPADERLTGPGVTVTAVGEVAGPVLFLAQPPGDRGWYAVTVVVHGWQIDVADAVQPVNPPCWVDIVRPRVSGVPPRIR